MAGTSFNYFGRNAQQQPVTGTLEAMSAGHVAEWLLSTGITPVTIEPVKEVQEAGDVLSRLFSRKGITLVDLMLFSRQMGTLARAGIPIMKALRSLETSATTGSMRQVLRDLHDSLDAGLELSQAMAKRGDVFDTFYVSMVKVGETTGRLEEIFNSLYKHLEFQKFMQEQVKTALRYPTFVVAAMAIAIIVINMVVIPAFAKVFDNMHAELPLMTRILLGSSKFMLAWWPAMLVGAFGAAMAW